MTNRPLVRAFPFLLVLHLLVFCGGLAALTWEILWLHHAALALGASAEASALVFSSLMLGFSLGSWAIARLEARVGALPGLKTYALLELCIGISGLYLAALFALVGRLDSQLFRWHPALASLFHPLGIFAALGIPALAMGASVPVFRKLPGTSLARLYACNTAGAGVGVVAATFLLIPEFGIARTGQLIGCLNVLVGGVLYVLSVRTTGQSSAEVSSVKSIPGPHLEPQHFRSEALIVACTGFAAFGLEVSWFRSFRAAFQSTTESFALMLFPVLLALALGAFLAPRLKRQGWDLPTLIMLAALLVLIDTPVIERVDLLYPALKATSYLQYTLGRLTWSTVLLLPPFVLVGVGLPWLIDQCQTVSAVSRLYTLNCLAAVTGSLLAAWVLLPRIGSSKTAWVMAGALLIAAMWNSAGKRALYMLLAFAGLGVVSQQIGSGAGTLRAQTGFPIQDQTLLVTREGPDSTVSVIERADGRRDLMIDGFSASNTGVGTHYMAWMGHLPMLLHPKPERALVICFGTGQTANAVRQEGILRLDVVDISAAVLSLAPLFPVNHDILSDPRVHPAVMDGRAWLRRSRSLYDVISLEPMPPTFAGVNSLYSLEFYQLAKARLNRGGIIAQWLPLHLVDSFEASSIVRTFLEVFPSSLLWLDPVNDTGILLGKNQTSDSASPAAFAWPGLERSAEGRDLSAQQIVAAARVDAQQLQRFAARGTLITDDNQLLSYGYGRARFAYGEQKLINLKILERSIESANQTRH
jgi:spermidine synthase